MSQHDEPASWVLGLAKLCAAVSCVAVTIWVLWTAAVIWAGGTVPLTSSHVDASPVGAIAFFIFGEPIIMTGVYWAWMIVFLPLGLLFRTKSSPPASATFVRHVAFDGLGGLGATFTLTRPPSGKHGWNWTYDHGVRDDSMTLIATHRALGNLEKELGLPLTWPDTDGPRKPRTDAEVAAGEAARRREREERAAAGDPNAISQLWNDDGVPVTDVAELVEGTIYALGYDLGVYQGSYTGRKWEGIPDLDDDDDDNIFGIWHTFETAESSIDREGLRGARISPEDIANGSVTAIPAPAGRVADIFVQLRAAHRKWELERGARRPNF